MGLRTVKYKNWRIRDPGLDVPDPCQWQGFGPLAARVLRAREFEDAAQARQFLCCCENTLHDPFLMKEMDRAVERIERALEAGEKIAIYGDYDVDGITSVCLLYKYLTGRGGNCVWYIPDRLDEGYGVHPEALDALKAQGVSLIITVDTGITAVEEVEYAKALGLDMVITDHHECKETLPAACAVVDPCRPDSIYPFKPLAGVGVAFKLACALAGPNKDQCLLNRFGDLVAVGTVADVMPLTGENRVIVRSGLCALEHPKNVGLRRLIQEAGAAQRRMNTVVLGFVLAPRLNAAGRMGQAARAVELLLSEREEEASRLASLLCELNRERQAVENAIYEEAAAYWDRRRAEGSMPSVLVLDHEGWHPGVIGIVASKLSERYSRPVLMICVEAGVGKGSARSVPGFNMFEALDTHKRFLLGYGGHDMAAGFSIEQSKIPELRTHMEEYGLDYRQECRRAQELELDCILDLREATEQNVSGLQVLEPYGTGNPQPAFCVEAAELESVTPIGGGKHMRLRLCDGRAGLDAVLFNVDREHFPFGVGQTVDVAGTVDLNRFRNTVTVQMVVTDIRESQAQQERDRREKTLYLKLIMQQRLSAREAREILPEREDFVALWRYLRRSGGPGVKAYPPCHLARAMACECRHAPSYAKLMICLDVMAEFELLDYVNLGKELEITMKEMEGKVDLTQGKLLLRLREMMEEPAAEEGVS